MVLRRHGGSSINMERMTILNFAIAAALIAQGLLSPAVLPQKTFDEFTTKVAHLLHRTPATHVEQKPFRLSF